MLKNTDKSCDYGAGMDLNLNNWGAAAVAFLIPAIMFFIFRIHLAPIFSIDSTFVVGSHEIDILSVFSVAKNPMNYRPLSRLLEINVAHLYKLSGGQYHTIVVSIMAVLNGLLSLLIYKICLNYSRSRLTGLLASFLYVFSVGGICASWHNLFTAFFIGLLLTICGAFFAYMQFRTSTGPVRWVWLTVFVVLCVVAPWFREFGYIPPAVVLAVETVLNMQGRANYVWVDCFTTQPLNRDVYDRLKKAGFQICLASPELQKRDVSDIEVYANALRTQAIDIDAICTKRPKLWEEVILRK